jgi:AbrB family looped-hinge helix DNA binding protein
MDQFTCRVDNQGRITLPVEWRKAHNVEPGSDVAVVVSEDRLEVQTGDQSLDEARRIISRHRKGKHSAVEMLREDRRLEASREQTEAEAHAEGL